MGDGRSCTELETISAESADQLDRNMILLRIAEDEKSQFEDELPDADLDNGFSPKEPDVVTSRSVPTEWRDVVTMAPEFTDFENNSPPNSYYELADLNMEPAGSPIRLARVPSQYQLDALSEMFIFDVPQHFAIQKAAPAETPAVAVAGEGTPYFVNSEYVSELLM